MGDHAKLATKVSETKQANVVSQTHKSERSQSTNSPVERILHLQQTIGNRAVQRMVQSGTLQAKLTIGQPGDKYEQEADRVADQVMRMPEPQVQRQEEEEDEELQLKPLADQITPLVQRQSEPEEEVEEEIPMLQRQLEEEEEEEEPQMLQRQLEEEDDEELQTKKIPGKTPGVTPTLESRIQALKGGGQPLSESARAFFEPRFGRDFSQVRVHTDTQAAEIVRTVNAKAFTIGPNIAFSMSQYLPETSKGQRLLAHELTHIIQQRNAFQKAYTQQKSVDPIHKVPGSDTAIQTEMEMPALPSQVEPFLEAQVDELSEVKERLSSKETTKEEEEELLKKTVQLTALKLMAEHRKRVLETRKTTVSSPENLREAATLIKELNQVDEELRDYLYEAKGLHREVRDAASSGRLADIDDVIEAFREYSYEYFNKQQMMAIGKEMLRAQKGCYRVDMQECFGGLFKAARRVEEFRIKHLAANAAAINYVYSNYPVFTNLDPLDVAENTYKTDEKLRLAASRAFIKLLQDIDRAIEKIATGNIHPYDLPKAVEHARESLPESLKTRLDNMSEAHIKEKFWIDIGLSLAEAVLVFLPVVGPYLTLAATVADAGIQLDEYIDRSQLEKIAPKAAQNPLLFEHITPFEKVLSGVGIILSSMDAVSLGQKIWSRGGLKKLGGISKRKVKSKTEPPIGFESEVDITTPSGLELNLGPQPKRKVPFGEIEPEWDMTKPSGLELDLGPQPKRKVPFGEIEPEWDMTKPSGLELDLGPQPKRKVPFGEIEPEWDITKPSGLELDKTRKARGQPRIRGKKDEMSRINKPYQKPSLLGFLITKVGSVIRGDLFEKAAKKYFSGYSLDVPGKVKMHIVDYVISGRTDKIASFATGNNEYLWEKFLQLFGEGKAAYGTRPIKIKGVKYTGTKWRIMLKRLEKKGILKEKIPYKEFMRRSCLVTPKDEAKKLKEFIKNKIIDKKTRKYKWSEEGGELMELWAKDLQKKGLKDEQIMEKLLKKIIGIPWDPEKWLKKTVQQVLPGS